MKLSIFLQSVTCYYQTVLGETPFPTTTRNISRYLSLLLGLYSSNQGKMSYTLSWDTDVEETKASNVILNTTPFSTSHKFMTRLAFFCNFICLFTRRSWWPIQTNWWNKAAWLGCLPRNCCSVNLSCRWNGTYCKPILTTRMMAACSATLTFVYYHTSTFLLWWTLIVS